MKILNRTYGNPPLDLACDEVLLDAAERGDIGPVLRFWESPVPFAVLGYSNRAEAELDLDTCRRLGVGVYRRSSGGGTVVQGPGCLNYSLVLPMAEAGDTIAATNRFVMEKNRAALERALGAPVTVRGHTDLCLGEKKFSGNAQRRKRTHLLFHGTFLVSFDLSLMDALRMPPLRPEYRKDRKHADFVENLGVDSRQIREALAWEWNAREAMEAPDTARLESAARCLSERDWIFRF